jgi:hypothetical protein
MTEWIKRSERKTVVEYSRSFMFTDHLLFEGRPTAGYGFPCDEQGNLLRDDNIEKYKQCLSGTIDGHTITDFGVVKYEHSYREPGVIVCVNCKAEVVLDMVMTNTCEACITCGQPEDFSWHQMTAEQCEAWMRHHTEGERGCSRESEHHAFKQCATDYNSSGQRLAPRSQWGWDTGESLDEILRSDWPIDQSRAAYMGEDDGA